MRMAARVALGVMAVPTVIGGVMLTVMVLIYFDYCLKPHPQQIASAPP